MMDLNLYDILKQFEGYQENPIFGDMRTQQVQRGNYYKTYYGKQYIMDVFVGLVIDVGFYSIDTNRARVVIELQNGKRSCLSAFRSAYRPHRA